MSQKFISDFLSNAADRQNKAKTTSLEEITNKTSFINIARKI